MQTYRLICNDLQREGVLPFGVTMVGTSGGHARERRIGLGQWRGWIAPCLGVVFALFSASPADAGLGDWFKNEALPTLQGKRPLKINPQKVTISHGGQKILDLGKNSLHIKLGPVSVKTGDLRKTLLQVGAVMAGDTAVLGAMAREEAQRVITRLLESKKIRQVAPDRYQEIATDEGVAAPDSASKATRAVTLYNLSGTVLKYALNDQVFTIGDDSGMRHESAEHYLQIDVDPGPELEVGRWYLQNSAEYVLVSRKAGKELLLCAVGTSPPLQCFSRNGAVSVSNLEGVSK